MFNQQSTPFSHTRRLPEKEDARSMRQASLDARTGRTARQNAAAEKNGQPAGKLSRFLIPALAAVLFILLARICCVHSFPAFLFSEDRKFERFTDKVFREELNGNTLNRHYIVADPSNYGLDTKRVSLGNASLGARRKACTTAENYLDKLETFDYEKLSEKHRLTYDLFRDCLKTELEGADWLLYDEPLGPTLGIQAQLPVLLAEYSFRTKGDIEDYLTLLSQIPDYFSSVLAFEQAKSEEGLFMSSECADEVVKQCREFIEEPDSNYLIGIFDEKIDAVKNLTADEKIAYKSRNQSVLSGYVIPAYETMINALEKFSGSGTNTRGLCYYPEGKEYYRWLVKSTVGDDRPIEEIEEAVKVQMVKDFTAIQELMKRTGAAGSGSENDPGAPSAMLDELREKIAKDFPLLPDVSCTVKYVHESLQDYLSPAFYLSPTIDDYTHNVIYINPASNYSDLELFTTLAHEGYPGHLYQSVYFNAQEPELLRNLLDVGGYTEGWATYVEMYAYSLWEDDPVLAALSQRNRSFTLGLASLLDIGIHYRGYSLDQVKAFLEQLGFGSSTAESLYRTILEAPANYLQYYVGCLNFCSLRDELKRTQGERFSLKEFHRLVLENGPAPFYILRKRLVRG